MLQSLSIRPLQTVIGGDPCNHSRAEPVADVLTTSDNQHRGINAVVNVYFRSVADQPQPQDYSFRCTFAELKTMCSQIQSCVGRGGHCTICKRVDVDTYMAYC